MFGIDRFTAIINPPEVGILAVGRTSRQIVPDAQDEPVVRPICTMTLSVDHRVSRRRGGGTVHGRPAPGARIAGRHAAIRRLAAIPATIRRYELISICTIF